MVAITSKLLEVDQQKPISTTLIILVAPRRWITRQKSEKKNRYQR